MNRLNESFSAGYAWLSARADLLDRINVFPIADSDTGTNLRISLGPLRICGDDRKALASRLHRSATGNSGNIAAAFFGELVKATRVEEVPAMAANGRQMAWQAIAAPRQGTMLNVFDTLATLLPNRLERTAQTLVIVAHGRDDREPRLTHLRPASIVDR